MDELPDNHFQSIQTEIMATINKRFTLSQTLSFLALALFFVSTTFKIFRFPLSREILLLSFGAIAASLLTTSLHGNFSEQREERVAATALHDRRYHHFYHRLQL